ncbi:zinc finger protein 83 isoform X2 [Manduca sexta]|uniref:zinc finger protein 83 isoform X2 n=1 Tax=Manduca sexta TaxID=7130 RepID=UPI00188E890A|nr:zinc finger protein 83 isoform X2 [Manduca sexta]
MMDVSGVNVVFTKQEIDLKTQCRTCLSAGRKLFQLREYLNIFKTITSQFRIDDKNVLDTFEVCWECHAFLRRASMFQIQVLKANVLLQHGQTYPCGSLSTLSTTILSDTTHIIYINESVPKADSECSDRLDFTPLITEKEIKPEYDIKKSNRWAQEKQIQNKKPKFKIVNDCNEIFKRITLSEKDLSSFIDGNTNKYICDICNSTFVNKRHLSTHVREHYNIYECTLCAHRCGSKERSRHFKNDHRTVFQCLKCKLMFCRRREFFKHFKQWHENFICDHCGISFKMRYCIKDHIRKQHSTFECKPCNKTFARYNGLWLHNKLRHAPPGQTAYCVECDKRYVDIYRYRWHLANSARHKPRKRLRIPCPGCDKVFSKNIYMKDHYNLVHLKYYKYRCEECDKNFIRNADLLKHKKRVHEGILPPKNKICDVCGRGFTTNKILTNHIRTHTGERPYVCTTCPAKFAQHTALVSHIRAVHDKREQ